MSSLLWLDISATGIKATLLPTSPSIELLASQILFSMRTLEWPNSREPELLSPDHCASVVGE